MADYKYNLDLNVKLNNIQETKAELDSILKEWNEATGQHEKKDIFRKYFSDKTIGNATAFGTQLTKLSEQLDILAKKGENITTADLGKYLNEIKQMGTALAGVDDHLTSVGKTGVRAIGQISSSVYDLGIEVNTVNDKFSQLGGQIQHEVIDNLVRMGFDSISSAISSAVYFTKDLNRSLTDIQVVSGKSAEDMAEFAKQANEASKALGTTTDEFAQSALIFYQQGSYTEQEVMKLAEATTIAANITRQSTDVVADQLTSLINAFGVQTEDVMSDIVDVFATVGAVSGSNFEELATATQKFASQAQTAGYEGAQGIQEMASQIAVVVETTRQSADSVGVGFKTILSRIQGIKDEGGEMITKLVDPLNQLNNELAQLGAKQFEVFDEFGDLRGADELINDLGEAWYRYGDQLSNATKAYVLQEVAGVEQSSRLASLFNNWDRYIEILEEAQDAQGSALQQQAVYMDSIDAKASQLRTTFEELVLNFNLEDLLKGVYTGLNNVAEKLVDIVETSSNLGGGLFDALGASEDVGKSLGAWMPLIGLVSTAFMKLSQNMIATRWNAMETQLNYQKAMKQALQEAKDANDKMAESQYKVQQNIAKYSGVDTAYQYAQIQKEILANAQKEIDLYQKSYHILAESEGQAELRLNINNKEVVGLHEIEKKHSQIISLLAKTNAHQLKNKNLTEDDYELLLDIAESQKLANLVAKSTGDIRRSNLKISEKEYEVIKKTLQHQNDVYSEWVSKESKKLQSQAGHETLLASEEEVEKAKKINQQNLEYERQIKLLEDVSDKNKKIQNTIATVASLTIAIPQVIDGITGLLDDTEHSANSVVQSVIGIATGILSFIPGWGQVGAIALQVAGQIFNAFGGIKTQLEKTKEANEELTRTFVEQKERIDSLKSAISGVEESYETISSSGKSAQEILSSNNEDLIESYLEYASVVEENNPLLVQGYDDQGRAIVNITDGLKELNELVEDQELANNMMMANNVDNFALELAAQYKDATNEINKATESQKLYREELQKAMDTDNAGDISKYNAKLSTINSSLSEYKNSLSEIPQLLNSNIVQPFFASNETILKWNKAFKGYTVDTENGITTLNTALNAMLLDTQKLYTAIQSGDTSALTEELNKAEQAMTWYSEAIVVNGEVSEELAKRLVEMPEEVRQVSLSLKEIYGDQIDILTDYSEEVQKVLSGQNTLGDLFGNDNYSFDNLKEGLKLYSQLSDEAIKAGKDAMYALEAYQEGLIDSDFFENVASFTYSSEDLEALSNISELDFANATESLEDYYDTIYDVIDALDDTVDGYNSVVEAMGEMEKQIEELESKGSDLTENELYQLKLLKDQYFETYVALIDEDNVFYANKILNDQEWVDSFAAATGIVATNYTTLQELMTAAEAEGVNARSYLLNQATQAELINSKQALYAKQQEVLGKLDAQKVFVNEVGELEQELLDAQFTTAQISKAYWYEMIDNVKNAFINVFNVLIDAFAGFVNVIIGGINIFKKEKLNYVNWNDKKASKSTKAQDYLNSISSQNNVKGIEIKDVELKTPFTNDNDDDNNTIKPNTNTDDDDDEDEVDDVELELDPLYEYTKALELLNNEMDILKANEKDLFGQALIENLQEQNKLLEQKRKLLESQATVVETQMVNQQSLLQTVGFQFDESGIISNYNEIIEKLTNTANAKSGEAKEQAIADLEQIKSVVEDYDDLLTNTSAQLKADLISIRQEIQENYSEQIDIVVQVQLDLSEAYKKMYEFQQKFNEGFEQTDDRLVNMGEYAENLIKDLGTMGEAVAKIYVDTNLTDTQRQEKLEELIDEYMDISETLDDLIKEMGETITESLEEGLELIEETAEGYGKIREYASEYSSILKDIYGSTARNDIDTLYDIQLEAIQGSIDSLKQQKQLAEQYVNALEPGTDEWKKAKEALDDINYEIANTTLELLETMRSKMEDFVELAMDALEKGLFGGTLSDLEKAYEKITAQQDKYLSATEKANALSKLQLQIQNDINESTDPKVRAQLLEFMNKELAILKEKEKLSVKDVERAEKLYVLQLKQQALENQQLTAMMARLVRDEAGNWSYEYVQDISKVNEAQEELSEALEDLVDFDKDRLAENQKEILDSYTDLMDELQAIYDKGLAGDYGSIEEMDEAINKVVNDAMSGLEGLYAEQDSILNELTQSSLYQVINNFKTSGSTFGLLSEEAEKSLDAISQALSSNSIAWADIINGNFDTIASQAGLTESEVSDLFSKLTDSIKEDFLNSNSVIEKDIEDMRDTIANSTSEMRNKFEDYFNGVSSALGNQTDAIANLTTALGQQASEIDKVSEAVKNEADTITNTLIPSYEALKNKYNNEVNPEVQSFVSQLKESIQAIKDNQTSITGSSGLVEALDKLKTNYESTATQSDKLNTSLGKMETSATNAYNKMTTLQGSISGVSSSASSAVSSVNSLQSAIDDLQGKNITIGVDVEKKIIKKEYMPGVDSWKYTSSTGAVRYGDEYDWKIGQTCTFDTGGYTGNWNPSEGISEDPKGGKLAVLHQKEIVLNKEDTSNLLEAVKINKEMFSGLMNSSPISNVMNNTSNHSNVNEGDTVYNIESLELPNIQNVSQFLEELKNLPNRAIQYKYSRKAY